MFVKLLGATPQLPSDIDTSVPLQTYVVMRVGPTRHVSSSKPATRNPEWNETFAFPDPELDVQTAPLLQCMGS